MMTMMVRMLKGCIITNHKTSDFEHKNTLLEIMLTEAKVTLRKSSGLLYNLMMLVFSCDTTSFPIYQGYVLGRRE